MKGKCKNKKCGKILPEGYAYKYCESCRGRHADTTKTIGKAAALVIGVVTLGWFGTGKKS